MKAVMYHYVRQATQALPFFRYLHIDNFIQQLDWFEREYRLLGRDEFIDISAGRRLISEKDVLLTFDDGFVDHYEYVFPELQKRKTFGIFYIPTAMHTRAAMLLDVHKIHHLTGAVEINKLLKQLMDLIDEDMLSDQHRQEFLEKTYIKHDDGEKTKFFKRTLNYFIDYAVRARILDRLLAMNEIVHDVASFYLTPLQIKEMHNHGMIIGSHSVTHPVFSKISVKEQIREIEESFHFIDATVGGNLTVKTFCYPYGGYHNFTAETENILTRQGVHFSFNVESRDITAADFISRPQALPRYDCNEFPYGKAS